MTYEPYDGEPQDFEHEASEYERPNDAEGLIRRAIDVVASAKTVPLSSSVLVSRDELLELLDSAVAMLPEELRQARWVLRDLDALKEQRQREADAILDDVRAEAARLVARTEIARQAQAHAERVVADAKDRGRQIVHEAEDFCDQRLAQMEIVLDRLTRTVQQGRERLRPRIQSEEPDDVEGTESAFFDQDTN